MSYSTAMQTIIDLNTLNQLISNSAVLILFGGEHCGICNSIKPKLENMTKDRLPKMLSVYIDCEKSPDISAQFSVFTLPTVKTFIEGMLIAEEVKAFSLEAFIRKIERSYSMWLAGQE